MCECMYGLLPDRKSKPNFPSLSPLIRWKHTKSLLMFVDRSYHTIVILINQRECCCQVICFCHIPIERWQKNKHKQQLKSRWCVSMGASVVCFCPSNRYGNGNQPSHLNKSHEFRINVLQPLSESSTIATPHTNACMWFWIVSCIAVDKGKIRLCEWPKLPNA